MRKIIFAQVLTTNGTTEFSGLYDENGNPVVVEMECDESGVTLTIWRNAPERELRDCGISEEEIERTWFCQYHLTHFIRTRIMQRERYDHSRAFFGLPEAAHRWRCRFFC